MAGIITPRVFISYARSDEQEFARKLRKRSVGWVSFPYEMHMSLGKQPGNETQPTRLRETCRLRDLPTYPILVQALTCLFQNTTPDVSWI